MVYHLLCSGEVDGWDVFQTAGGVGSGTWMWKSYLKIDINLLGAFGMWIDKKTHTILNTEKKSPKSRFEHDLRHQFSKNHQSCVQRTILDTNSKKVTKVVRCTRL